MIMNNSPSPYILGRSRVCGRKALFDDSPVFYRVGGLISTHDFYESSIPNLRIESSMIPRNCLGQGTCLIPDAARLCVVLTGKPFNSFTCAIQQVLILTPCLCLISFCIWL